MALMTVTGADDSEIRRARATLEASAMAYREVVGFRDKLSYVVNAPGSPQENKAEEYVFGPNGAVMVKNALLQAAAIDSKFYLVQSDVPDRYIVAPYDGDFGATLDHIAGNGSLFEPPPLVLHEGKGIDGLLKALQFNLFEGLKISGLGRSTTDKVEIRLEAKNGELTLTVDARTHFFTGVSFEVKPPGAPESMIVRVNGTFSPQALNASEAAISFDPGTRTAVEKLTDLVSKTHLAAGSAAPDFALETLEGKKVGLHELRGRTVVLDFWATWCVPCWTGLKETEALSQWVALEHLPVSVFAVNTLEHGSDKKDKFNRVRRFWESQHFTMPSLIDEDSQIFGVYQSPGLPSVVVISPNGKIFRYHEGLFPQMLGTLKGELHDSVREPSGR